MWVYYVPRTVLRYRHFVPNKTCDLNGDLDCHAAPSTDEHMKDEDELDTR